MKNLKFFLPLAAVGLLASCANDNLGDPTPTPEEGTPIEGMYVSFNIDVPAISRAATYEVGAPSESTIKNVYLYLYRSKKSTNPTPTEDDLELYAVKPLGGSTYTDDQHNQGTGTGSVDVVKGVISATFQLKDMTDEEVKDFNYYALIIVNQGDFTVPASTDSSNAQTFGTWKPTTWTATAPGHVVFEVDQDDLKVKGTPSSTVNPMVPYITDGYYFTMTNAPLYNKPTSGDASITYLAQLQESNFATSPKAAQTSAATIFVQRGVAKVKITPSENNESGIYLELEENGAVKGDVESTYKVAIEGWSLDVLNTKTYALQKVEEASAFADNAAWGKEWFLGSMGNHQADASHIFWSIDPEYDQPTAYTTDKGPETGLYLGYDTSGWNALTDVEYCLENTMKPKMMQKDQTTTAIFRTKLMKKGEGERFDEEVGDFVIFNDIVCPVAGKVVSGKEAGEYSISELITSVNQESVREALKANSIETEKVTYYPGGVAYYTALIRHFAESGQPGASDKTVDKLDDYGDQDLGRYGVVRNNAYNLKVKNVYGYGSNKVPTPTPDPNDKPDPKKYNVMIDVEVLNWAIREYDYTLH